MELVLVVAFFIIPAVAAPRWGVDSRPRENPVIAYTGLEVLTFLRTQGVERVWKMAALAAQIPSTPRPSLRDALVRTLRALASYLDPDLPAPVERTAPAA